VGEAWNDTGLVFTRENGTAIHPERLTSWFEQLIREAALCPRSVYTTFDIAMPPRRLLPASQRRSSVSDSAMRP
jgi:hypothetical protein